MVVGCVNGSNGSPSGQTGGTASGGRASAGAGGGLSATGRGGTTGFGGGTGGVAISGGQAAGGTSSASGGKATGGASGSAGAQSGGSSGSGGMATGGAPATGGQGSGGKNTGGSTGAGGAGGKATGGAAGNGGSAGASSVGGSTAGGASGTGGKTGTPDASTSDYHPCPTDGTVCKIMPFGDSITDGYNQDTPGGYRVELFRLAHSAGKNITFVGKNWNGPDTVDGVAFPHNHEGHSGWAIYPDATTNRKGISQCLQADPDCLQSNSVMLEYSPHIVLLMIGTNDAISKIDLANAPTRLGKLIDTIYAQLPNILIVVAQPVPSRGNVSKGDDATLSDRIKTYDDAIPAIVQARADKGKHILIVDMYTPFNSNKASLLEDEWHPNLSGYVLMGTQWYSVLQSLL